MATDDQQRLVAGTASAPASFTIPGNGQMQPKSIFATYDGSAAGSPFIPALKITSDAGKLVGIYAASTQVAAGGSANVSWFPWRRVAVTTPTPSPNPLGTLWAWWDFSDVTTLSIDGSSKISAITDKTGNGHNLSQLTPANRPAQSTLNGLNAALCDSTNYTALVSGEWSVPLAQPYTILCVNSQTIAGTNVYLPGPYGALGLDTGPTLFTTNNGAGLAMLTQASAVVAAQASPYTKDQFSAIYDAASSHLRINGADTAGTVDNHPIISTSVGAQHFPKRGGLTEALDGQIGEVLVYSGHLTAPQLTAVEAYLKAKWATP